MQIICPECQFAREVDESKIPSRSQVATCPKCKTKFKFRELPEDDFALEEPVQAEPTSTPAPTAETQTEEPAKPAQAPLPLDNEASAPTFPPITAPGEDPKEELWDKLGEMTPPEAVDDTNESTKIAQEETPRQEQPEQDVHHDESRTPPAPPAAEEQQPAPGWTGEFTNDFPDPMQEESHDDTQDESGMLVPPPFEQLDRYGFFQGLFLTIKLVLTSPRLFFSVMPVGGGFAKPLTFTILLTMVQSFVQYFWAQAGLASYIDTAGGVPAPTGDALGPIMMLLFLPAVIAAGQFVVTGIYHVLLILMRADNQGFEGTFRALAYANAPIILGLFPMPIREIEIGWMFITAGWGLFLTIMGLKYIHRTSFAKVVPICLIPLLLGMIMALMMYNQLPTI